MLITSVQARRHATRLGYLTVPIPLWYQDKNGMVGRLIEALESDELSFLRFEKLV
jgi:hypothetical protein